MESFLGIILLLLAALAAGILIFERRRAHLLRQLQTAQQTTSQLRDELSRVRMRLDLVIQNVNEGIVLIDASDQIAFMSPVARDLLGVSADAPCSLNDISRILGIQSIVGEVLEHRAELLGQTVVKDDRVFQVNVRAFQNHSERAVMILLRDVTELQRLGRVRRDFVANISHELGTPVTSLRLLTDTLSKELATNPALAAELVVKLRQPVGVLQQLAEEMMGLALIESGQMPIRLIEMRVIDLVDPALAILETQAKHKDIQIDLEIPVGLCVLADPEGMRRVFNNLIHNAIKFTPTQGRISIRASQVGDNVEIQIKDTGIGIPARDLPRIFERFYKVDQSRTFSGSRGTGLGLAIAKHFVEGHGGKIWAESIEGKGSTFYFTLPASER